MLDDIVVVIDIKRIGKLGLQTGISLCDVEGIGIISDVKQLGDVGLAGVTTIMKPEIALFTELIMKIDGCNGLDNLE